MVRYLALASIKYTIYLVYKFTIFQYLISGFGFAKQSFFVADLSEICLLTKPLTKNNF